MQLGISRKTHLALQAVWELASREDRMKGAELAKSIGTSATFLAHVMTPLVRNGWVQSEPGRGGGYTIGVRTEDISVLDLIEAVEGPTDTSDCVLRGGVCDLEQSCAIHDAWKKARDTLIEELSMKFVNDIPKEAIAP